MHNERQRILALVEKGTISAKEAITLLEALEKSGNTTQPTKEKTTTDESFFQEEKKEEQSGKNNTDYTKYFQEEMQDLRKDLSQIGSLFMDMMNTAVKKVKEFDVTTPFGERLEFAHTEELDATGIQNISVDLPNGHFSFEPSEGEAIQVMCKVKAPFVNDNDEETRSNFLNQFVVKNDEGTLRILSHLKIAQVNVKVLVPVQKIENVSIRVMNGSVTLRDAAFEELKVKTLNGAIKGTALTFNKAKVDSSNGAIELTGIRGRELEAETLNGRVYVDGALEEVEAKSVNGHVVVTNCSNHSSKVKAQTVAGTVELYVPRNMSLNGKIVTNFGKADVGIQDVKKIESQDQFLSKVVRFEKEVEGSNRLHIEGESKTGAVLVRYTSAEE